MKTLADFAVEIISAVQQANSDHPPLVPGSKQCRFCKARANCAALADEVFGAVEVEVTEAPADVLADCMDKVDLVEVWAKAVRGRVEAELLAGHQVRGYKLVQGRRGARSWTNSSDAETLLKTMRVPHDRMYDYSVISPTSADKLAKEGVIGPRQWPRVQQLITQSEGKPSVAPESDKRPALVIQPDAFQPVSQPDFPKE